MFFKGTRYEKVATNQITDATGRAIVYKKIRFIPTTVGIVGLTVGQGDRFDQIAYRAFRDSQRFWRICDANDGMWPDDLLQVGEVLEIPPSES
jgi:hypothetical protein